MSSVEPTPPSLPPLPLLDAIYTHALQSAPAEVCGAWSLTSSGLWQHHQITNIIPAPQNQRAYQLDPIEWYHLLMEEERGERSIKGCYHSHPGMRAQLSPTDQALWTLDGQALYPQLSQLIVGWEHADQPHWSLYHWDPDKGRFTQTAQRRQR